ncbi:peptidoglycan-associated lipoprotein Pal [Paraferrimonas sp. SM1919]|uniref:peptidoglycan-associated lipoprotein Pal n=1 Tax=Paraferrimonas sp. SM1919 TaxID=2662263 RepID=UPI0013D24901|nr:peptidoglycan-associated lipoprotein Pal [Paraferrimonas sp. SM1919]
MTLNKLLKAMLVAAPAFAITACSSTSGTDSSATETTVEAPAQVDTGAVEAPLSAEEIQRQKQAELRREHIIYFDFDRSDVSADFAAILEAHAEYLVANSNVTVLVEGHADERGTPEYNVALGERRAQAVSKYLQGLGVAASQISIVSYGEEKPLDVSSTEEGFAKNRRAVLVY